MAALGAVVAAVVSTPTAQAESRMTPVAGEEGLYEISGPDAGILAWSNCLDGQTCFFQDSNGGGVLWVVPTCWKNEVPSAFDNRASSVWNKGGGPVDLFYNHGWTGYLGTVPHWWQGNLALEHNDRLSSVDVRCR
ncbi:peptidase inhibitor family I36 protein [Streptomyces scopuliridis]|uniref:peptidase inhibitor family I36 protein n=1 Tax=Streptomyces scopuliridis TaxID=452529 RepID=UPI0036C416DE